MSLSAVKVAKTAVATGSSYGAIAHDSHARKAVKNALAKMQPSTVGSVLLFLTSSYAHKPQNALKEAARAAGTPLIFGCCAMSLLTEQEWLLDVEGAVAMVFPSALGLQPVTLLQQQGIDPSLVLTLSSPNAATMAVNSHNTPQIGAISTDEYGHGPFSVWQSGRIVEQEFAHNAFPNSLKHHTAVADGVRPISPIVSINQSESHNLIKCGSESAYSNLLKYLPENLHSIGLTRPYNLLAAISENDQEESIREGHYKVHHIVSIDESTKRISLSGSAKNDHYLFWAIRDEQHAQQVMYQKLKIAKQVISEKPKFALMFPNISRGPEFFNGRDRDLEQFKACFPNTPLIGFYGNGEIAPGHCYSGLIHRYSTVFTLFA